MIAEAKAEVTEEVEDGKDEDEEEETENSLVSLKFTFVNMLPQFPMENSVPVVLAQL